MKINSQTNFEFFFGGVPVEGLFKVCNFGHFKMGFHYNLFLKGLHYELHIMIFTNILKY
jgi:hypothetical protein